MVQSKSFTVRTHQTRSNLMVVLLRAHAVLWSSTSALVYAVESKGMGQTAPFAVPSTACGLHTNTESQLGGYRTFRDGIQNGNGAKQIVHRPAHIKPAATSWLYCSGHMLSFGPAPAPWCTRWRVRVWANCSFCCPVNCVWSAHKHREPIRGL